MLLHLKRGVHAGCSLGCLRWRSLYWQSETRAERCYTGDVIGALCLLFVNRIERGAWRCDKGDAAMTRFRGACSRRLGLRLPPPLPPALPSPPPGWLHRDRAETVYFDRDFARLDNDISRFARNMAWTDRIWRGNSFCEIGNFNTPPSWWLLFPETFRPFFRKTRNAITFKDIQNW